MRLGPLSRPTLTRWRLPKPKRSVTRTAPHRHVVGLAREAQRRTIHIPYRPGAARARPRVICVNPHGQTYLLDRKRYRRCTCYDRSASRLFVFPAVFFSALHRTHLPCLSTADPRNQEETEKELRKDETRTTLERERVRTHSILSSADLAI